MLLWWRTDRGTRRSDCFVFGAEQLTIPYSESRTSQKGHLKFLQYGSENRSWLASTIIPTTTTWAFYILPDWSRAGAYLHTQFSSTITLDPPFQTQRRTTQITLCPLFQDAWPGQQNWQMLPNVTEKACPNNLLLLWRYYDEEETPVRGNTIGVGATLLTYTFPLLSHPRTLESPFQTKQRITTKLCAHHSRLLDLEITELTNVATTRRQIWAVLWLPDWNRSNVANLHIPTMLNPHSLDSAPFPTKRTAKR